MATFNNNTPATFTPADFGELLVATAQQTSVAMQVTNVVTTNSREYRIPIVNQEITSAWYGEGETFTPSDIGLDEEVIEPKKIVGFTKISREFAADASPEAQTIVGQSIARSIARWVDVAFIAGESLNPKQPAGLNDIPDSQVTIVEAGAAWENVDPFTEATIKAESVGAPLTAFVAGADVVTVLSKLKREAGSNEPLLAPDANSPTLRTIAGVPLYVSNTSLPGVVYGISAPTITTVVRNEATIETDHSRYFDSGQVAVRGEARIAFGFPWKKAIVRIKLDSAQAIPDPEG
ncbi:phage major capsid protein [Leucobacter sp. HY1910]